MNAADAHAFVAEHGLGDAVSKVVADAPELSAAQRESLHAIFQSQNATTTGSPKPADALTDHGPPRDRRSG